MRNAGATVLIAGIGGASLGTEVAKSLRAAGGYRILGCDISPLAFGHYAGMCDATFLVSADDYIEQVLAICKTEDVTVAIPGGDQPMRLIAQAHARFDGAGVKLGMNATDVVCRLADKASCFAELERLGFEVPQTIELLTNELPNRFPVPCVVKPALDSGGSSYVFFARNSDEVALYAEYLRRNGKRPIAQAYTPHDGGEFTVGVLSAPTGEILGTIALERAFPAKLSVMMRGPDFLISSGYSQGRIAAYPEVCATATAIARAVGSVGPLNVQGRVDARGRFLPFEINPRFSASTYLRTLAGFNEVDAFIKCLMNHETAVELTIKPGWYLRSLTEVALPEDGLKSD